MNKKLNYKHTNYSINSILISITDLQMDPVKERIISSSFYCFNKLDYNIARQINEESIHFLQHILDQNIIDTNDLYETFRKHSKQLYRESDVVKWFIERIDPFLTDDDVRTHIIGNEIMLDNTSPIYTMYLHAIENGPILVDISMDYARRIYQGERLIEYFSNKSIKSVIRHAHVIRRKEDLIIPSIDDHILNRMNELKNEEYIIGSCHRAYLMLGIYNQIDECVEVAIIREKYSVLKYIIDHLSCGAYNNITRHVISIYERINGVSFSLDNDEYTIYISLFEPYFKHVEHINSEYSSEYFRKIRRNFDFNVPSELDGSVELMTRIASIKRTYNQGIFGPIDEVHVQQFRQLMIDIDDFMSKFNM